MLPRVGTADTAEPGRAEPSTGQLRALVGGQLDVPTDPPTESEIAQSATAFEDLSGSQALALAREEFASLVEADLFPGLDLSPRESVDSFLGPNTATIDVEDRQPDLLAESTLPLRAPEPGLGKRPLDGDLVVVGDHLEVDNAPVEAEISTELDKGVTFDRTGVAVSLGNDSGAPQQISDKLFYPNVKVDTDTLVAPTPFGVEISYQLRSGDSPEELALDFSLPQGSHLEATEDGGAVVRDSAGEMLTSVTAPLAADASGNRVPVDYEASGSHLVIHVDHRNGDILYPVLVDPVVEEHSGGIEHYYQLSSSQPNSDWTWVWGAAGFTAAQVNEGLLTTANSGYSYPWTASYWKLASPNQSFIERASFYNFYRFTGNPATCTIVGVYSPAIGNWEPGTVVNEVGTSLGSNGQAVQAICDGVNQATDHASRHAWVGWDANPADWVYDSVGHDGNYAYFGLLTAGYRSVPSWNFLRSATVYRYDYNNPQVGHSNPSAWRDDDDVQTVFSATDAGLGVASLQVYEGTSNSGTSLHTSNMWCNGSRAAPCPGSVGGIDAGYVPQGTRAITAYATDIIGHRSAPSTFTSRVDRTDPSLQLSGALWNAAGQPLAPGSYPIHAHATDGSLTPPSAQRSGVASIRISVDGVQRYALAPGCTVEAGSCTLDADWSYNTSVYGPGPHVIGVEAADALGHIDSKTFVVGGSQGVGATTFSFTEPRPLSSVVDDLTTGGMIATEFTDPDGGFVADPGSSLEAGEDLYTDQYSDAVAAAGTVEAAGGAVTEMPDVSSNATIEPQVTSVTVVGDQPTTGLGSAATLVSSREYRPPATTAPPAGANSDGERNLLHGGSPYAWTPSSTKVISDGAGNGFGWVYTRVKWSNQSHIDAFNGDAFEADLKLLNRDNSTQSRDLGPNGVNWCPEGVRDNFWVHRPEKTAGHDLYGDFYGTWHTNLPSHYLDTKLSDSCQIEDLSVGVYHTNRLNPDTSYYVEMFWKRGDKKRSPVSVGAQKVTKNCPGPGAYCTAFDCPGNDFQGGAYCTGLEGAAIRTQVWIEEAELRLPNCARIERTPPHWERC